MSMFLKQFLVHGCAEDAETGGICFREFVGRMQY